MNTEVMFSSKTDQWATPQSFFDELNSEFHFTLDPCADEYNHKCDLWFDKNTDGLKQNWGGKECIAIHLMAEKLANGLRNVQKKAKSLIRCV